MAAICGRGLRLSLLREGPAKSLVLTERAPLCSGHSQWGGPGGADFFGEFATELPQNRPAQSISFLTENARCSTGRSQNGACATPSLFGGFATHPHGPNFLGWLATGFDPSCEAWVTPRVRLGWVGSCWGRRKVPTKSLISRRKSPAKHRVFAIGGPSDADFFGGVCD